MSLLPLAGLNFLTFYQLKSNRLDVLFKINPKQRPNYWKTNRSKMTKLTCTLWGQVFLYKTSPPPKAAFLHDPTHHFLPFKRVTFQGKYPWAVVNLRDCHELLLPWRSNCKDVWFGCPRDGKKWKKSTNLRLEFPMGNLRGPPLPMPNPLEIIKGQWWWINLLIRPYFIGEGGGGAFPW